MSTMGAGGDANVILVTGATGFVGRSLVHRLAGCDAYVVRAAVRRGGIELADAVQGKFACDLADAPDWMPALAGVHIVVHAAARVHLMTDDAWDPLAEFRRINVEGTLHLARQSAAAGVRRFVFISTVKVNGESTPVGMPFVANSVPAPQDPYGISKMEAEQGLRQISAETGMELVVIRPPLVYGPDVRANFRMLLSAVARGVPLPFGAIDNRRSLVSIDNLVDFILTCIRHPAAVNQTFMVSDGEDLSTAELIRRMAKAMGRPARLVSVPIWFLRLGAMLLRRQTAIRRLCENLQVDIRKNRDLLEWVPIISVDEGLRRTVHRESQ